MLVQFVCTCSWTLLFFKLKLLPHDSPSFVGTLVKFRCLYYPTFIEDWRITKRTLKLENKFRINKGKNLVDLLQLVVTGREYAVLSRWKYAILIRERLASHSNATIDVENVAGNIICGGVYGKESAHSCYFFWLSQSFQRNSFRHFRLNVWRNVKMKSDRRTHNIIKRSTVINEAAYQIFRWELSRHVRLDESGANGVHCNPTVGELFRVTHS